MDLSRFPRVRLAHLPTPLEPLPRLSRHLGGPRIWCKRDDCTGLAFGGNKARSLEFYLGDALAAGADTLVTTGAVQSNHARSTAAAAARLGLACEIQVEDRVHDMPDEYRRSGNPLLTRLLGARVHAHPEGEDEDGADAALERLAERVRREGGRPYVIALGPEHPPLGALGYVEAAFEILDQAAAAGISIGALVTPTGSASTHAGLLAGLRLRDAAIPVHGICIRRSAALQEPRVRRRIALLGDLLGRPGLVPDADVRATDAWLGPGYGKPTAEMIEAVRLAATTEGLLLDPVYSGKAMAGLIGLVRAGAFEPDENVVFLHTGGTPALFAYTGTLERGIGSPT